MIVKYTLSIYAIVLETRSAAHDGTHSLVFFKSVLEALLRYFLSTTRRRPKMDVSMILEQSQPQEVMTVLS